MTDDNNKLNIQINTQTEALQQYHRNQFLRLNGTKMILRPIKILVLQVPSDTCMFQKRFLSLVDVRQGPIERTVTHIVRQKAPDYLSLKEDDTTTKKPDTERIHNL